MVTAKALALIWGGRIWSGFRCRFSGIILGYSQLLVDESESNEMLRNRVREIQSASQRAASLTRQPLAFARKQVLQEKT